jgi:hypothetical protein
LLKENTKKEFFRITPLQRENGLMLFKNLQKDIHAALIQLTKIALRHQDLVHLSQRKLCSTSDQPKMISKMASIKRVNFKITPRQTDHGSMLSKNHLKDIHAVPIQLIQTAQEEVQILHLKRKLFIQFIQHNWMLSMVSIKKVKSKTILAHQEAHG